MNWRRSTRASLPFSLPSKELTATDWAGLMETAIAKDSKGYRDRLRRWILATNNNPKGRLPQVASVRMASFWYQELVHAADYLDRKNAEYAHQLDELSASSPLEQLPDCLNFTGCIDDIQAYQRDIEHEQQESLRRRIAALDRILSAGELHYEDIQSLLIRLKPFLYLPDGNYDNRARRVSVANPTVLRGAVEYISATSPESSPPSASPSLDLNSSDTSSLSTAPPQP